MNSGLQAEQWAVQHLQQQGLTLVVQNYRSRFGEIDIIMQDKDVLVFVEVRLRRNGDFGGAAASIDARKQQRIIHTAQHYLGSLKSTPPCRFDAVLIDTESKKFEWLKSAFDAS
jgi:putative endonuclease